LLPIEVPAEVHAALFDSVAADPDYQVTVNLADQKLILAGAQEVPFEVDGFARQCLLDGVDELGWILRQTEAIQDYEKRRVTTLNTLAGV